MTLKSFFFFFISIFCDPRLLKKQNVPTTEQEKPQPSPTSESMLDSEIEPPYVVEEPRMLDVEEGEPVRFCTTIKGRPRKFLSTSENLCKGQK